MATKKFDQPIERERIHVKVDDETIAGDDPMAVVDPVWWTANFYDGPSEYEESLRHFSKPQRYVWATIWCDSEVRNGGFYQFYSNSTGMVWPDALAGLDAIGLPDGAAIVRESADRLGGSPPLIRSEREELLDRTGDDLDDLNDRYYAAVDSDDFSSKLMTYIRGRPADFYFSGFIEKPVRERRKKNQERADEAVSLNIELTLTDYLSLQVWCRKVVLVQSLLLYTVFLVLFTLFMDVISGESLSAIAQDVMSQWKFDVVLLLGVFAAVNTIPFILTVANWLLKKLPREMRISIDGDGIHYSVDDRSVSAGWSNVRFVTEDKSAYIIRLKTSVLRIPKRAFDSQRFVDFERIVAQNLPASAVRIARRNQPDARPL